MLSSAAFIRSAESFSLSRIPLQYKKPSSAALIQSAESFLFQGSLSSIQKAVISCLRFVQRKASSFKALSLQYKKPFISCLRFVQRQVSFFLGSLPSVQKALLQLPSIRSAERFLFHSRLSLSIQSPSSATFDPFSGKLPFFQGSFCSIQKSFHQLPSIRSTESFVYQGSLSSIQKALHQLPVIRSAESFLFFKALSIDAKCSHQLPSSRAAESFRFSRLSLQSKRLHQLPVIRSTERFLLFSRLSLFNAKCSSSAAFDLFSGKLQIFQGSLSSVQKALHQLPLIQSAERFLFSRLSLSPMQKALHQLPRFVQRKASFFLGSLSSIQKAFISCLRFVQSIIIQSIIIAYSVFSALFDA